MEISVVLAAIQAAMKIIDWVAKMKANAAQTGAWTPAERAKVDAEFAAMQASPAWQVDKK